MLDSQQAHASDLAELEGTPSAHRLPVYDAKPDEIFTKPDTVKKAIEAAP